MLTTTIVAPATAEGKSAIAVVRLSGSNAIKIVSQVFRGKDLNLVPSHTIHYGYIYNGQELLDEVMVSVFHAPRTFTTEQMVEISCHGSPYIVSTIIDLLARHGAVMAKPGEFTLRAFLNGRIDLTQAEAVADLIAADSHSAQQLAMHQIKGGFKNQIQHLRSELVSLASLIELELDFSEEDVQFADRSRLLDVIAAIQAALRPLIESFRLGNVIKNGVPVAIVGRPNAGKSTLLNGLLNEERAIVSAIAGTTRDTIEEVLYMNGIAYRFIDTAGIRSTTDAIEEIGVAKALAKITEAALVIHVIDGMDSSLEYLAIQQQITALNPTAQVIEVVTKRDLNPQLSISSATAPLLHMIATDNADIALLKAIISQTMALDTYSSQTIVTSQRHITALHTAQKSLTAVTDGITAGITTDLLAYHLKAALHALGEITGEVTNDEVLGTIFGKFCIGK